MGIERALGRITLLLFELFCQQVYVEFEPISRPTQFVLIAIYIFDIIIIYQVSIPGSGGVTRPRLIFFTDG
jgi:hypothetical protein